MAGQLLPIRLLSTTAIFRSSPPSSLSHIFTKLSPKNSPFSPNQCRLIHHRQYSGGRPVSSRPSIVSAKSKSLIEDEAELSDWISDLKSDSFGKQEVMDPSKGRGRNSRSSSFRRKIDSDDDDDDVDDFGGGRMGNGRGNRPAASSDFRKRVGDQFGASSDSRKRFDDAGDFGSRIGNRRGNRPGDSSGSRKRFDDGKIGDGRGNQSGASLDSRKRFDDGKVGNGRGNRSGASLDSRKRFDDGKVGNGRGNRSGAFLDSRKRFDDGKVGNGRGNRSGEPLDSRKRVDDQFGASSAFNKRGRGDFEGGGRVGQHKRSQGLAVSSSEEDEEEDDEDEESEEEESDDVMSDFDNDFFGDKEDRKDRVAKGAFEKGCSVLSSDGDIAKAIPRTSMPTSDSYLSESRYVCLSSKFDVSKLSN